jgi:hypothetical protein
MGTADWRMLNFNSNYLGLTAWQFLLEPLQGTMADPSTALILVKFLLFFTESRGAERSYSNRMWAANKLWQRKWLIWTILGEGFLVQQREQSIPTLAFCLNLWKLMNTMSVVCSDKYFAPINFLGLWDTQQAEGIHW